MNFRVVVNGPKLNGFVLGLAAFVCASLAIGSATLWWNMIAATGTPSNPQALARQSLMQIERQPKSARNLAQAERLTREELAFGPYRPAVWCRLAYIQYLKAGRLDGAAAASLRRAYQFGPYDPAVSLWRAQLIFDNWTTAPGDLKQAALRETRAYYSVWDYREPVELMAAKIRNPAGRLAVELVMLRAPLPSH